MRNFGIAFMIIMTAGLAGLVVWLYMENDRKAPEITISSSKDNTYREDMTEEEILNGITAFDDKDGDVSDTLKVESVYSKAGGEEYNVTIVAKDLSNNIAKIEYVMIKPEDADEGQDSTEYFSADERGMDVYDTGEEGKGNDNNTAEPLTEEERVTAEEEKKLRDLSESAPHLYLTTYYKEINVGESIRCMDYVLDITDDVDSQSDLFRSVGILEYPEGIEEVTYDIPGTYQLTYQVQDSKGNISNDAMLMIVVK